MFHQRGVRCSLMLLPLAAFSGLGLLCQPAATVTNTVAATTVPTANVVLPTIDANLNTELVADTPAVVDTNSNNDDQAPAVDVEAQNRDAERVARITKIRDALESYKTTNSAYPEKLDVLLNSGYLTAVPKDLDDSDFSYTPIGALPAQYYDLCYTLEVGAGAITAGYHCANPDGVANP